MKHLQPIIASIPFSAMSGAEMKKDWWRFVGWVRRNVFVPVPRVDALDELNRLLLDKCKVYANTHKIPGRENPVKDLLLEDQKRLCPLPGSPFECKQSSSLPSNTLFCCPIRR
jgi:hypothetical protein